MEKRIMRLAWNTNRWKQPSGHQWDKSNYRKKGFPFEKGTGYGHEDWLFNPRFQNANFQFGYIQGVHSLPEEIKMLDEIHLYTIQSEGSNWYYLGHIAKAKVISNQSFEYNTAKNLVKKYAKELEEELKMIGADFNNFKKLGYMPNICFAKNQSTLLSEPILIDNNNIKARLTYYKPIKVDEQIEKFIVGIREKSRFIFRHSPPGHRTSTYEISSRRRNSIIADRRHDLLEKEVYEFLVKVMKIKKEAISCGLTEIEGKNIDIAIMTKNGNLEIFEIKTEVNARLNIRAALGQLFDYGLWLENIIPHKFIIVGESLMSMNDIKYFKRLKQSILIQIEYWCFNEDKFNEQRFTIYS